MDHKDNEFVLAVQTCLLRNDWDEALDLTRRRLSTHPGDRQALIFLARILVHQGDLPGAEEAIGGLVLADEEMLNLFRECGDLFLSRHEWRAARSYYERSLSLLPDAVVAEPLGRLAAELGPGPVGAGNLNGEMGVKKVPADFHTMTLVDLYVKQGHLKEALEVLEAMRQKDPANEKVAERIRGVHALMGGEKPTETAGAVSELERWLQRLSGQRP